MEGEEVSEDLSVNLPEDLVERILAMVPFPYIFKARTLSKSWLARLSPSSSEHDQEKKLLAISFQNRMGECFAKWDSFYPVFVSKNDMLAYQWASEKELRLSTLSILRNCQLDTSVYMEGALLLVLTRRNEVFVANVLTGSWKLLPDCSEMDGFRSFLDRWMVPEYVNASHTTLVSNKETYKVIKFIYKTVCLSFAEIYDSKLGAWSRKRLDVANGFYIRGRHMYLNGVVYWFLGPWGLTRQPNLLAFNFEEETFDVIQMPPTDILKEEHHVDLVVCNGSVLMVVCAGGYNITSVIVLKLDPESQRWVKVTDCRPAALNPMRVYMRIASHGDCISFEDNSGILLAYNVEKDEWRTVFNCKDWSANQHYYRLGNSFQPSLNPFMVV